MNVGQVVAAMAGGALLTVTAVSVLALHIMWRRAERQRRIEAAANAVVTGVETFRQRAAGAAVERDAGPLRDTVVAHSKRHLKLLRRPGAGASGRRPATALRDGSRGAR